MEVGSPENGFDEISDLFKHDESTLSEDLGLSFLMNKDVAADYAFGDLEGEDKFNFCFSEQGHCELPSLLSNFRYYDPPGHPLENLHSSARISSSSDFLIDTDAGVVLNEDNLQMRSPKNHQHEDTEKLCSGYLRDFASQVDLESINSEVPEVLCRQPQVLASTGNPILGGEIVDTRDSPSHYNIGEETFSNPQHQELDQSEFTSKKEEGGVPVDQTETLYLSLESESGDFNSRNSGDGREELKELDLPHVDQYDQERTSHFSVSTGVIGEICVSPETSLYAIKVPHDQKLSASHGPKDVLYYNVTHDPKCCKAECFDPSEDPLSVNQSLHAAMENCASSKGSPAKHVHIAKINDQGVKRSRSQSPVKQTYSSSRCKKDSQTNSEARLPQFKSWCQRSSDKAACSYQSPGSPNRCVIREGHKEQSYYSSSSNHKYELARTGGRGREVTSKDHLSVTSRQNSAALQESRRVFKDSSSSKCAPASPSNHSLEITSRRKVERSGSPSPISRRNLKRECDKSRSRYPYPKDICRQSSRTRYSSRHKSSSRSYSAHNTSLQARYLSRASYRRTGIGKPGRCLFVAGFEFSTTEGELERKFSRFGHVRDVRIIRDKRSGLSRGYGFLSLERDEEADAAIRALHKTDWNGRVVLVEKSIK
ncbi:uncharacterized protein [Coffea arabica]|uniref:Uncharacterized protein isoform X1 n=1 Tax=Coffea arabica TaxID=13443 RepID=A0A6P6XIU6_COFAR